MKVIIIAANAQKAAIADELIQDDKLSKVLLTISSKKLVEEAQALIIYYETKEDLQRLQGILKIYTGVPLKFYFGDKSHKNFQHFYHFKDAKQMVEELSKEFTRLQHGADKIYENILIKDQDAGVPTVETLLQDLKARDIIEEKCLDLFSSEKENSHKHASATAQKKKKIDTKDIKVDKKRFRKWWTQSKQDNYEFIKYYIVGWLAKQVKEKSIDEKTVKRLRDFRGYQMRRKQIRILKEHYESAFSLKVNGKRATIAASVPPAAPVDVSSKVKPVQQEDAKIEESKQAKDTPTFPAEDNPHEKAGTEIEVKVTFFPDKNLESMVNLKNLHIFNDYYSWLSIGIKPKQKDLKTFIEDLSQFEYLDQLKEESSYDTSIVLDGKKVRLGLQHWDQLDPQVFFNEDQKESLDLINELKVMDEDQEQEAQFQFNISLGKKLIDIIKSDEPLLVSLMESMAVDSSMKFHLKQFKQGFENLLDGTHKEYIEDLYQKKKDAAKQAAAVAKAKAEEEKEAARARAEEKRAAKKAAKDLAEGKLEIPEEEVKSEEQPPTNEEKNDDEDGEKQKDKEDGDNDGEEKPDDEENEDEGNDEDEDEYYGEGQDDEGVEDDEDDEEEDQDDQEVDPDKKSDEFNLEECLKNIIPLMLLKWNAKVKLSPDLDEFVEYCKLNKEKSFLFKSFSEAFKSSQQDQQEASTKAIRRGSKAELLAYLVEEMGFEAEIAWKTQYFFLSARVKSQDLGNVLAMANKASIIE